MDFDSIRSRIQLFCDRSNDSAEKKDELIEKLQKRQEKIRRIRGVFYLAAGASFAINPVNRGGDIVTNYYADDYFKDKDYMTPLPGAENPLD